MGQRRGQPSFKRRVEQPGTVMNAERGLERAGDLIEERLVRQTPVGRNLTGCKKTARPKKEDP
jgi:hypothetical protein